MPTREEKRKIGKDHRKVMVSTRKEGQPKDSKGAFVHYHRTNSVRMRDSKYDRLIDVSGKDDSVRARDMFIEVCKLNGWE